VLLLLPLLLRPRLWWPLLRLSLRPPSLHLSLLHPLPLRLLPLPNVRDRGQTPLWTHRLRRRRRQLLTRRLQSPTPS